MARFAVTARLLALGLLIAILIVPLVMINELTSERAGRRESVFQEVTAVWGGQQTISGPVLSIPYTVLVPASDQANAKAEGAPKRTRRILHVAADEAEATLVVDPEIRRRGIFEAPVYTAKVHVSGRFTRPPAALFGPDVESIAWPEARLSVGLRDLNGVASQPSITWGGQALEVGPGTGEIPNPSLTALVPGLGAAPADGTVAFDVSLTLRGGRTLMLAPLARASKVAMQSAWPSPSFGGARLPDRYRITAAGFSAEWSVSAFGRTLPQSWTDCELAPADAQQQIDKQAFGVTLAVPVDVYQQADRSTKYGLLFVALTFVAFFVVETLRKLSVHPVQYLMVGAALCLFYLLLLSLSEHIGFTPAYITAAAATIALIGGYAKSALRGTPAALMVTGLLTALYGCLYVLLQLEDYALMVGAVLLFAILAIVMFVTRRVDWYGVGSEGTAGRTV